MGRFSGRKQKGDHDLTARGIWKLSYITYLWPGHTVGPSVSDPRERVRQKLPKLFLNVTSKAMPLLLLYSVCNH